MEISVVVWVVVEELRQVSEGLSSMEIPLKDMANHRAFEFQKDLVVWKL